MGVSEIGGTLFGGPVEGILFYLGYKLGTPLLCDAHMRLRKSLQRVWGLSGSLFSTLNSGNPELSFLG